MLRFLLAIIAISRSFICLPIVRQAQAGLEPETY